MYITEDVGDIYVDMSNSKRVRLNAEAAEKIRKITYNSDGSYKSEVSFDYDFIKDKFDTLDDNIGELRDKRPIYILNVELTGEFSEEGFEYCTANTADVIKAAQLYADNYVVYCVIQDEGIRTPMVAVQDEQLVFMIGVGVDAQIITLNFEGIGMRLSSSGVIYEDYEAFLEEYNDQINAINTDIGKRLPLDNSGSISLKTGADLDDIKTEGVYIAVASVGGTLINSPTTSGQKIIVMKGYDGSRCHQLVFTQQTNAIYHRMYNGSDWTAWANLSKTTLSDLGITATATELNYVDGVTDNIQTQLSNKLSLTGGTITGDTTFTKNITASGGITGNLTGNASTATALTSKSIGSGTQPVYFDANGKPVATTYELNADVPSGAKFTDTTYSNFVKSGSGAKAGLVPAPSTTAGTTKYLREDGAWAVPPDNNTTYTFATGDNNGQIKVTPSGGSATNISVKGLSSAAYATKGAANGVAELDANGKVPSSQLPVATGSAAGITIVYPAASCTTFSSDSGTITPLAAQKAAKMFAITRPTSVENTIPRFTNTTGDVESTGIKIESVTNSKDSSKTAHVLSIPAEGGKKMVYGYCTDQVDGTSFIGGVFDADETSFPYSAGLAIGGTSGNLLWKGSKVITESSLAEYNYATTSALSSYLHKTSTTAQTIASAVTFNSTTASSSKTTGAVIVKGGMGVSGSIYGNKVYGAVWNDYAEYRQGTDEFEAGRVVCENGDDTLSLASERLQPGANIVSDTFGFAIGETETAKTPLAVSGRVLAYPYEDRESYKPGDAVCAAPNGTVSKMTREEIREYPERIVGTVSAIPTYETWGENNIPVNGRIWIKVK